MALKILMVCLGNICRSPLAEGLLASKLPKDHFIIDSAGTGHWHVGEQPDVRSIAVAKKYGIDISQQKAQQIKPQHLKDYDYIFAMDQSNYEDILKISSDKHHNAKVFLLLNEDETIKDKNVPDPYYGGSEGFENVFHMLDKVCDRLATKLIKKHLK